MRLRLGNPAPPLSTRAGEVRAVWLSLVEQRAGSLNNFDNWIGDPEAIFDAFLDAGAERASATAARHTYALAISLKYRKTTRDWRGRRTSSHVSIPLPVPLVATPDGEVATRDEEDARLAAEEEEARRAEAEAQAAAAGAEGEAAGEFRTDFGETGEPGEPPPRKELSPVAKAVGISAVGATVAGLISLLFRR